MERQQLEKIITQLDFLRKLIDMDMQLTVFNEHGIVQYAYPEDRDFGKIKTGEMFEDPTGKLQEALKTGKCTHVQIPDSEFGYKMERNFVPVFEQGQVKGCVSATYLPTNQQVIESQQVSVHSIYYLILSIDVAEDMCAEIYKSLDAKKIDVSMLHFLEFKEQSIVRVHKDDREAYKELMDTSQWEQKLARCNFISCEARIVVPNGGTRWLEFTIAKGDISVSSKDKYLYMVRDIHERKSSEERINIENSQLIEQLKKANEALFKNGMSDEMTQMYNRKGMNYFSEDIYHKAKRDGNLLFIYVTDLNGLKYINDYFGHLEGDNAIRVLGKILRDSATEEIICARTGGDEFVMLANFPEKSEKPYEVVHSIQKRLDEYNRKNKLPYMVEASFGYFFGKVKKDKSLDEYITMADERMYEMKKKLKELKSSIAVVGATDMRNLDYGKDKILIVEDDRLIREVLKNVLKEKYLVIEAENGVAALKRVKYEENITLVLLDINMPGMDGFGVLEEMKKKHVLEEIPVIMMTTLENEDVEVEGYKRGVADFVRKPVNPVIVMHRIENVVQLYKRQKQLKDILSDKVNILENQAKRLADQAEQLRGNGKGISV